MTDAPPAQAEVKGSMIPYLMVADAYAAADFYVAAFGATDVARMPKNEHGHSMHVHVYIHGQSVMLGDPMPEHGHPLVAPQAFNLMLRVPDVDAAFKRAIDAGGTQIMAPHDAFWGDRYAMLKDPVGVSWALSAPLG
ncbi:glyoxalase/bleomycin resistance/extradiol dioxygenase family protein [soil metagenome]